MNILIRWFGKSEKQRIAVLSAAYGPELAEALASYTSWVGSKPPGDRVPAVVGALADVSFWDEQARRSGSSKPIRDGQARLVQVLESLDPEWGRSQAARDAVVNLVASMRDASTTALAATVRALASIDPAWQPPPAEAPWVREALQRVLEMPAGLGDEDVDLMNEDYDLIAMVVAKLDRLDPGWRDSRGWSSFVETHSRRLRSPRCEVRRHAVVVLEHGGWKPATPSDAAWAAVAWQKWDEAEALADSAIPALEVAALGSSMWTDDRDRRSAAAAIERIRNREPMRGFECADCGLEITNCHYDFESILLTRQVGGQCRGCGMVLCEEHHSRWVDKAGKKWCPGCQGKVVWLCEGPAYSSMVEQERRAGSYNACIRPPDTGRSVVQE